MNSFLLAPESMKEHWPGENTVSCYEILFPVHSRRMEVENICRRLGLGDWFILYQLGKNMDPMIFREFMEKLHKRMFQRMANGGK